LTLAFELVERYLQEKNCETFLHHFWPKLKNLLVLKILRGKGQGQTIRSIIKQCPDHDLQTDLLEFTANIKNSKYYVSDLWWAFSHWLTFGTMSEDYPQIEKKELLTLERQLTREELGGYRSKVQIRRKLDANAILGKLQPNIRSLCRRRMQFISRGDPAGYSLDDLVQEMNCLVLSLLHSQDHCQISQEHVLPWLVTCVDNALQNMINYATNSDRSRILFKKTDGFLEIVGTREVHFKDNFPGERKESSFEFEEILRKVKDPRIKKYLEVLLSEEHNPEFWSWFKTNIPHLAGRQRYLAEEPEAIGPWIQRWLGIGRRDLIHFLHSYLPDILVEMERKKTLEPIRKGA